MILTPELTPELIHELIQITMSQRTKQKITKSTNIRELIAKYPQAATTLLEYGLHCVCCSASIYDTIEVGAKAHGLSEQDIDEMVARINEIVNNK